MRTLRLKARCAFAFLAFFAAVSHASAPEYRVVDATGTEVLFARAPKRILPLQPSLAELVDRVGVPHDQIVGVTAYTDFPLGLKGKPSVGSYVKPNLEAIVALKPDLVLASRDGTPRETVTRLRKLGIPVVAVATETIAGLRDSFPIVGTAVGRGEAGAAALADFDRSFAAFKERGKARPATRVLLQVGEDPLVVAGGKTFLHEGLSAIGATNVYPGADQTYPRVSVEDVLKKDPEVIVLVGMGDDVAQFKRAEKRWNSYASLAATRRKKIVLLRSDSLVRPGPRFLAGLSDLENAVYSTGVKSP